MKKRKICVLTGTRAEYGILKPVLNAIKSHNKLKLFLIAAGTHLSQEFGYTKKEIIKDGFKIDAEVKMTPKKDKGWAMVEAIGIGIRKLSNALKNINPDILLILGDRIEPLAAAIAATYMNIPIAHIHGGDVSSGTDEHARHAITKLSHIHFPATKKSKDRIIKKLGENPKRVFMTGSPAVDMINNLNIPPKKQLLKKYKIDKDKQYILVLQHPESRDYEKAGKQMEMTLKTVKKFNRQIVVIYPASDAGSRAMIKVIKKYESAPKISIYKNLPREDYLGLLKYTAALVGNSSSGMIDASIYKNPVVNIGDRERHRERGNSVIDVEFKQKEIFKAVKRALTDKNFRKKIKRFRSPYGTANARKKIADVLADISLAPELLQKNLEKDLF